MLCLFSIFSGYLLKGLFLGNSLLLSSDLPLLTNQLTVEYIPIELRLIPVFFSGLGLLFFYFYYTIFYDTIIFYSKAVYLLLVNKFFFDSIINYFCLLFLFKTRMLFFIFDKGLLEIFGPSGSYYFVRNVVHYHLFRSYLNNNFYLHVFLLAFSSLIFLSLITICVIFFRKNFISLNL